MVEVVDSTGARTHIQLEGKEEMVLMLGEGEVASEEMEGMEPLQLDILPQEEVGVVQARHLVRAMEAMEGVILVPLALQEEEEAQALMEVMVRISLGHLELGALEMAETENHQEEEGQDQQLPEALLEQEVVAAAEAAL